MTELLRKSCQRVAIFLVATLYPAVQAQTTPNPPADASCPAHRLASRHLPNLLWLHERVFSGGLPADNAAFAELADLGVKTVISVDGELPDVELAKRHGLQYVHLPHGYDTVEPARAKELAKAIRYLPGPVYIHCHHGKHRSPTAATVGLVTAGMLPDQYAVDILKLAGTSTNYRGLFQAAAEARAVSTKELDDLAVEFRELVPPTPLVKSMVELGHLHERLQSLESLDWQPLPGSDVKATGPTVNKHARIAEPAHQALLIQEQFAELLRRSTAEQFPEEFSNILQESQEHAQTLENSLRQLAEGSDEASSGRRAARQALKAISDDCIRCHRAFRD